MSKSSDFKKNPKGGYTSGRGDRMTPSDLDGLGLENITPEGKPQPVGSRLSDVKTAISIYATLRRADERSSIQRARTDAMFDGTPPYDQSKLISSGQGQKTNLNFGVGQRVLDIAMSAYVDLYSSLETFADVYSTWDSADENVAEQEEIVADEITKMQRSWPEFHSSYLRLCNTFVKHGVGCVFFDDPSTPWFRVGGFNDILIPRQTPASEEAIDVAIGRRSYMVHELFKFIENEQAAEKNGWVVDEVKRGIIRNTRTTGRNRVVGGTHGSDYEALQQLYKNNDIFLGLENPTVSVLHFWVRETDGSVSHYMALEEQPTDFLYKSPGRFMRPEQAYIFFTNGVGTNGTYHSVRGLGQRIYSYCQTMDKFRCQAVDGAMLGSSVMLQPQNQRALDELEFTYYGAYSIMSPEVQIVEKAIPNMSNTIQPVLNDLTNQLLQNTDTVTAYGPDRGSPYRNQMQVASDLEITSRISGASINLFYMSWDRVQREVVRRVVQAGPRSKDPRIKAFFESCFRRGVSPDFFESLDLEKTEATRSVGNGSAANRMMVHKELAAISGQFDEVGQKNLTRDTVATLVGHKLASRYAPRASQGDRETVDIKIAMFENTQLMSGIPMEALSTEMHGKHLREHIPELQSLITGIDEGTVDPVAAVPVLEAFYTHIDDTVNFAIADPNLKAEVGGARQILQFAEEKIVNGQKAQMKIQREQQEQAAAEGQAPPQGPSSEDLSLQQEQVKMDIARRKADQELELRRRKFDQEQALKDAEMYSKIRRAQTEAAAKSRTGTSMISN